jgi:hypothetical protein
MSYKAQQDQQRWSVERVLMSLSRAEVHEAWDFLNGTCRLNSPQPQFAREYIERGYKPAQNRMPIV